MSAVDRSALSPFQRWTAHALLSLFTWSAIAPSAAYAATGTARAYTPKLFVPKARARPAIVDEAQLARSFAPQAAAKSLAKAADEPTAADLAQTTEVVITPAVQALADSLGKDPVRIHYWVRNNVELVPSYGSMQAAQATLDARRGNAYDIATLTIALLRASQVPSRYVYGTIELPAAIANNWVGGATSAAATAALLSQGGIPSSTVVAGGQITAIQLEHVWVEAYVDFTPSRAGVRRTPNAWAPIDASFKQNALTAGVAGATLGQFNAADVAAAAQLNATITPDGATSLNSAGLASAYAAWVSRLQTAIGGNHPTATVAEILGGRSIVAEDFPILMGTLPFKTLAVAARYSAVPDQHQWKVRYGLYASEIDRVQGNALVFVESAVASLAHRKLTLGFAPTNAAEKQALDGLLLAQPFPTSIPGYQVRMKAQLRLDGTLASEGGDALVGTKLVGGAEWRDPAAPKAPGSDLPIWTQTPSHDVVVGETHALAVAVHGVPTPVLAASRDRAQAAKARLAAQNFANTTHDELTGELLGFAALAYAGTVDGNARVLREAAGVLGSPLPSIFRASTVAQVTYVNGAPNAVSFPGVAIDTLVLPTTAVAKDGSVARARGLQRLLGSRASVYGQLVAQRLFTDATHTGDAASGARAISRANDTGTQVFSVTGANIATVKPQLNIDAATEDLVEQAAGSAHRVAVTQDPVAVPAWIGAGYAIDDPESGTTEYEITGRLTAALYPQGGLGVLALAGHALAAGRGDAVVANLWTVLDAPIDMTTSIAVLNADYRSIAWASWAGAPSAVSAWWLAAIDDGSAPLLGAAFATIVDGLVAGQVTTLTGVPQPNNPPRFDSQPVTVAAIGQPYQYLAVASDPDGDPLTYTLAAGPSGMSLSASGLVTWAAPTLGAFEVLVRVSDGKATVEQRYVLNVGEAVSLDLALGVVPQFVNAGDTVTITVATVGGRGPVTRSLMVDGVAVALDANGQARVTAAGVGGHDVVATATDGTDTLTRQSFYAIADPADTDAPVALIVSPADAGDPLLAAEITAPVDVMGTVTDARLAEWRLEISPKGKGLYTLIARGTTQRNNQVLARFNPTTLANGLYDVVLRAVDAAGRETVDAVVYEVTENLKVGQFSVSFLDVAVEAAGIPVQVTRTYDTRRKIESLDFGHGWTVDYQNVKLQKNVSTGLGWVVVAQGLQNCVKPTGKRKVSVTLPDGRVERFEARLKVECALVNLPQPEIEFIPVGKTTSSLEAVSVPVLVVQGGHLIDSQTALPWNPKDFKLTTLERFVYELDEGFGIRKVTEPNGNFVTYGPNGVVHSDGSSVTFTRDPQNRITRVTDPNGKSLNYAYDPSGNLATVTDRENLQSVHKYDGLHTLTSFTDPRGTQLVHNEYDGEGRLVAQYDATGAKIDLAARTANQEVVRNRRGNTTTYEYDAIGNVSKVIDAANGTTLYGYDPRGNEATVTDPLGHTTTRTFDADDNQLTEKDHLDNLTTYTYRPKSRDLTKIVDARNNPTDIDYTVTGNLRSIKNALNEETVMGYEGANLTSLRDGAGNTTTYEYDAKGRRTKETDAAGGVTTYEYDANGNAGKVTKTRTVDGVPQALVTTRVFDADGNAKVETDPLGHIRRTTYNALKKVETQADPLNRVTRFDYDARGYETRVTHPDGGTEEKTYDPNGNEASVKDRAGRVTSNTYDALDRLTRVTYADGRFVENTYDAAGRLTAVKDERGNTTTHEYDEANRRTRTTDAENGVWQYRYDPNGNLTEVTDPRLNVTTHEYDAANRRVKTTYPSTTTDPVARFESWRYDGAGRRIGWTDTAGRETTYGYDGAGRLTRVTQPSPDGVAPPVTTEYGYDEVGNKTSQKDALGRITRWEYDALGRVTRRTLPGGQSESFTYDAVGNVASHTTFNSTPAAPEVISYTYDNLNRLKTKSVPVPGSVGIAHTITYAYTPTGQVATVTDARGVTSYDYDARDRVTQVTHPEGWVLGYTYDAAGNRATMSTRFGAEAAKVTAYEYDRAGRVTKVTSPENEITTFTYDAAGNRATATLPNGTSTAWTYDQRNRVTRVEHRKGTTNVVTYTYVWNAQGLRSREIAVYAPSSHTCQSDHTYDALGRLTRTVTAGNGTGNPCLAGGTWNYTYDAVGNRLTETGSGSGSFSSASSYDANDRLTAVTGTKGATYDYDAAGNVVRHTETTLAGLPPLVTEYRWDAEGRMVGVTPKLIPPTAINPNPEQPKPIAYLYDAEGQLVGEVRDTVVGTQPPPEKVTHYLPDKNLPFSQILEERDGTGALKAAYQFAGGMPLRQFKEGAAHFYHADHLSVGVLTDATGAPQARYVYSPFGELVGNFSGTGTGVPTVGGTHLFAGERLNADSGLYYNRARWLDPRVGRFATIDSARGNDLLPSSLHDYVYANANPVDYTDAGGRFSLSDTMSGLSSSINLANNMISLYGMFFGNPDDVKVDGIPGIWDYLFAFGMKAVFGGGGAGVGPRPISGNSMRFERHHTIPFYVCGADDQWKSYMPKPVHDTIHDELYDFVVPAINIFGYTIDYLIYKKPRSRAIKTPIQRAGTKAVGRGAIAAGLAYFYTSRGFIGAGMPPVGLALTVETPRFIGRNHTAPNCRR